MNRQVTKDNGAALLIRQVAEKEIKLEELSREDLEKIARLAMVDEAKAKFAKARDLARIDYAARREQFLLEAGHSKSRATRYLYDRALTRLEEWCTDQGITPLELDSFQADRYVMALRAAGSASATVNVYVAAASSFFGRLERWGEKQGLRNPFRGTKARPRKQSVKKTEIPSEEEIRVLLDAADPLMRAAITVMAYLGLRVGGLPDFSITGNRWLTFTKGKEQSGEISEEIRAVITRGGLSLKGPFVPLTAQNLKDRFGYLVGKLVMARKITQQYSCHDLRHAFAVRLYEANGHDIYRLSKALGHANIGVTETYLKSLKGVA